MRHDETRPTSDRRTRRRRQAADAARLLVPVLCTTAFSVAMLIALGAPYLALCFAGVLLLLGEATARIGA